MRAGSLDQTPVVRLSGNHLYLLSHLSSSPAHKAYSFLFFMFKFISIVFMHVFLCGEPVHLSAGACGSRRILDSLGLDLEVVMSHLRWALEIRLRSSTRDVCAHGALSSSDLKKNQHTDNKFYFYVLIHVYYQVWLRFKLHISLSGHSFLSLFLTSNSFPSSFMSYMLVYLDLYSTCKTNVTFFFLCLVYSISYDDLRSHALYCKIIFFFMGQ